MSSVVENFCGKVRRESAVRERPQAGTKRRRHKKRPDSPHVGESGLPFLIFAGSRRALPAFSEDEYEGADRDGEHSRSGEPHRRQEHPRRAPGDLHVLRIFEMDRHPAPEPRNPAQIQDRHRTRTDNAAVFSPELRTRRISGDRAHLVGSAPEANRFRADIRDGEQKVASRGSGISYRQHEPRRRRCRLAENP